MRYLSSVVAAEHEGLRADRYAADVLRVCSRSQLKQRSVAITINGKPVKPSHPVRSGDTFLVQYLDAEPYRVEAEAVALDILYEDDDVVVVNKPSGMVVHPAYGSRHGTLMQGLLHHVSNLDAAYSGTVLGVRPGIVHRLDKDTSGVIITAKNPISHEYLARQFRQRHTVKVYVAIVKGSPPRMSGVVEGELARDPHNRKRFAVTQGRGKQSRTRYWVIRKNEDSSLVRLQPETGRTHQLRVHMKHIGCPILGDSLYARQESEYPKIGLMLHAYRLTITTPDGVQRTFTAPLPDRFLTFLSQFLPGDNDL